MRRRTHYPFRLPAIALAISVSLGATGCTPEPTPPDDTGPTATSSQQSSTERPTTGAVTTDPTAPTEPADTTSTGATETTTAPAPTPSTTATARPVHRLRSALVPAAVLPGFNDSFTWDNERIFRGAGSGPLPGCSRATLISIGGVAAARSNYRSTSDDSAYATQVTARFPDEQTASRAESVLIAWHDRCQSYLRQQGRKHPRVGSIAVVATDVGTARQWLSTYGPVPGDPNAVNLHAEGFVRAGLRISYLVMHSTGQDYNYERGDEPMVHALEKAAEYLDN